MARAANIEVGHEQKNGPAETQQIILFFLGCPKRTEKKSI
jgi:hypothetical protein